MRLQPFQFGDPDDILPQPLQTCRRKIDQRRLLDKIIHRQRRKETGGAAGREGVIGPGQVIAGSFRGEMSHKNSTGIFYLRQDGKRVVYCQLQVFRGDPVGEADRLFQSAGNDDRTVALPGLPGDTLAGEFLQLFFHRRCHRLAKAVLRGDENGGGKFVMLRLGKEIGSNMGRGAAAIVDYQDF